MFIKAGALTLHVDPGGRPGAPVLVLLHSLGTNLHLWDPQIERLGEHYRLLRLDMRGHGLSEVGTCAFTIEDLAEDVLLVCDHLDIDEFYVAGVSIGGMIAQRLADRAPCRLLSMMLVDTSLAPASAPMWQARAKEVREFGLAHLADEIVSRWVTPGFWSTSEAAGLKQMLRQTSPAGFAGCAEALAKADLRQCAATGIPALVLVGDGDLSTPLAMARELAAVRGADLKVLAGAAHIPNLEQPEALSEMLLDFLAAPAPATPSRPRELA